jgi:hypothetical protein
MFPKVLAHNANCPKSFAGFDGSVGALRTLVVPVGRAQTASIRPADRRLEQFCIAVANTPFVR